MYISQFNDIRENIVYKNKLKLKYEEIFLTRIFVEFQNRTLIMLLIVNFILFLVLQPLSIDPQQESTKVSISVTR